MDYRLLLVDGHGAATAPCLHIRTLREFPGEAGVSVHFRPVRNDRLFESAAFAAGLAWRVLLGEGVVRHQLWVEYELPGDSPSVVGRSCDLLFALALVTARWERPAAGTLQLAATGVLDEEGAVQGVDAVPAKLAAALQSLPPGGTAMLFYPMANGVEVERWLAGVTLPAGVALHPVAHLDDALAVLGYALERVYLGNPFRGLNAFGFEHRSVFFGREADVRQAVALLLRREEAGTPGLLVEGASGSGKSSFLRAGLVPALLATRSPVADLRAPLQGRPFSPKAHLATWRPGSLAGPADEADLVASILARWALVPECRVAQWPAAPTTLAQLADCLRSQWPATLRFLWLVDPLEELLRIAAAPGVLQAFGRFLLALQAQGAWTLAAIRADAVPDLRRIDALRQAFGVNDGHYYLTPLAGLALDDVISLPARAAALTFGLDADGRRLDQILREDVYGQANGLPLLQFTLDALYQRRAGRELSVAAYRALGGLAGSVSQTARAALAAAGGDVALQARLYRSLVSVDEQGRPTRRSAPLSESEADPPLRSVQQAWVESRLCVTDQRDGEPVIALAHDTLLQSLPALAEWLQRESGLVQTRELALRDLRLWQQHGESDAWLASADKLALYRNLETAGLYLSAELRRYLDRSQRRERRAVRRRRHAVAAIGVLAVVASIAGWLATRRQHEAERQAAATLRMQQKLAVQVAADRLAQGELAIARGIVLDVLARRDGREPVDPMAANVFQDVRSRDSVLAVLPAHENHVRYVRYSPDGRSLAVVPVDGPIQVWDAELGIRRVVLEAAGDTGGPAEFSADGRTILSGGAHLCEWDARTGRLLRQAPMPGGKPGRAQYLPGGTRILVSNAAEDVLDATTWKLLRHIEVPHERLSCRAVFPDGVRAVCHLQGHDLGVLDLATGRILSRMHGHTDDVGAMAVSPDGQLVATGSNDTSVRVWKAATGQLLRALPNRVGQVWGVAFSPDGRQVLAAATDHSIRVWDLETGTQAGVLSGHSGMAVDLAFSPAADRLASVAYDGTVRTWAWGDEPEAVTLGAGHAPTADPSFTPDGAFFVAPSSDKGAQVWRLRDGAVVRGLRAPGGTITWAGYTRDGTRILTASDDRKLQWWDASNGSLLREMGAGGDETASVGLSPDGRLAAIGHLYTWTLHDTQSGALLRTVPGHKEYVTATAFSPDGGRLLTTSLDHTVALWNVPGGDQQFVMQMPDHVYGGSFSHDGARVLAGSEDHIVRVWDAHDGRLLLALVGHPTRAYTGAFSPDDRWIATAGQDRTVRVWDARSGEQLAILRGFPERVGTVNWTPDGQLLVPTTFANTVHFRRRGELPPLAEQIRWAAIANPDPLTDDDRRNLGLDPGNTGVDAAARSTCEAEASAPYDPARRAAGHEQPDVNADLATAACDRERPASQPADGAWEYLRGRALWAAGRRRDASVQFEAAWHGGHAAAGVDGALVQLEADRSPAGIDAARRRLAEAWQRGVARAATELARLEGRSADGEAWLRKARQAGDPGAFALAGEWEDRSLLDAQGEALQQPPLLAALGDYCLAVEAGERAGWPALTVRDWRFRRATLARLLARRQHMHEAVVAAAGGAPPPAAPPAR